MRSKVSRVVGQQRFQRDTGLSGATEFEQGLGLSIPCRVTPSFFIETRVGLVEIFQCLLVMLFLESEHPLLVCHQGCGPATDPISKISCIGDVSGAIRSG